MSTDDQTNDYQSLNQELEQILDKLQSSDVSVDEALAAHTRGMSIIQSLEKYLQTAENKITKLQAKQQA